MTISKNETIIKVQVSKSEIRGGIKVFKYILDILKEKGFSVEQIAEHLNISKVNFYKKINGDVKFSLKEAQILAGLLGTTVDTLFNADLVSINEKTNLL